MIIENSHFQFQPKANRGEFSKCKKGRSKSNALTAAKAPWCLSSLQQASRFTAARVSRNTCLSEKVLVRASVLTRNKHGQDEETIGEEERWKSQLASSSKDKRARNLTLFTFLPS
jgi:hypothetical protein